MIGDTAQIDNKELIEWIDGIPFSRPARNLTRNFSDAVLTAEVLKLYYPRHVELHNYVPANSINIKKENWKMLNRKVLAKLDMKLSSDTIHQLANGSQDAVEKLLTKLRVKVLRDGVEMHKPKLKDVESNILNNHICDALANVTTERIEDANDENVQRTIYTELKQELREKKEVISTLNHKITYLESSMKLKDLRISSLAAQILQNAVEMDRSAKSQSIDDARAKLRSRSHNFHEAKTY
ncbi:Sperm flagellar protein 1 [Trachymyrmex cornetzi]|uniref:Sperm flagellar protein 1 n=1 Tax=Trachymyrmex cornetzi TaxID=471704 RepID=A0A151IVP2_9HYME|nr:Sperm flagellar protein 1 [Trachymyrmex cornetzi]